MIKNFYIEKFYIVEILLLYISMLFIKVPNYLNMISTTSFVIAILILIKNRKLIKVDKNLKILFFSFFSLILFFSLLSIDIGLSGKGLYDVFRGFIYFLISILFVSMITKYNNMKIYLLILSTLFLVGNFLFDRGSFYGYFINPNNVAINVFIVTMLGLVLFQRENKLNIFLILILFAISSILLFEANSRNVLLGIFVSLIVLLNLQFRSLKSVIIQLILLILFISYMFLFNYKGFSLSSREDIWIPLLRYTYENNLLLGSGFNTIKLIITEVDSFTSTAHNLFIEIFVGMGIVGLLIFIYLVYRLVKIFISYKYDKNITFLVGLMGIICMIVFFQFDLKFASKPFLGMFFIFLGFIYSQKLLYKK